MEVKKIDDAQEFAIYKYRREQEDLSTKEYRQCKTTILLSEIYRIDPVDEEDYCFSDTPETYVYFKDGSSLSVVARYDDLRKVWIKYLKQ